MGSRPLLSQAFYFGARLGASIRPAAYFNPSGLQFFLSGAVFAPARRICRPAGQIHKLRLIPALARQRSFLPSPRTAAWSGGCQDEPIVPGVFHQSASGLHQPLNEYSSGGAAQHYRAEVSKFVEIDLARCLLLNRRRTLASPL